MIECQNSISVDENVYIPAWTRPVPGMHTIMCDLDDQYRIQLTQDIVYDNQECPLKMQLFTHWTEEPGKKYPVVIHVRGSGFLKQDVSGFLPQLAEVARWGYVVASIEYRTSVEGYGFPAQIEDTKKAIYYLKEHAEEYRIDPERFAVFGDSSGGHTALMAGFTGCEQFVPSGKKGIDLSIRCIIDVFGIANFQTIDAYPCGTNGYSEDGALTLYFGTQHPSEKQMAEASPVTYITKEHLLPPTLILHGDRDRMVPFAQSVELYQKMVECGQEADFYMVRNGEHGSKFWIPQVMEVIRCYLKAHM